MPPTDDLHERGREMLRAVQGDERADAVLEAMSRIHGPFADIALTSYGAVWSRTDALSLKLRNLVTIAIVSALGEERELAVHIRAGLRSGWSQAELLEAIGHVLLYAGAPRGMQALHVALEAFDEPGQPAA